MDQTIVLFIDLSYTVFYVKFWNSIIIWFDEPILDQRINLFIQYKLSSSVI